MHLATRMSKTEPSTACHHTVATWICILAQVFRVLGREGINVKMMSQGASKTNISLIVDESQGRHAVQCLHNEFFDAQP